MREPSAPPVLRARGVTVSHRGTVAVSAADLDLDAGEIVALVGPNGAGKSSLLAALALPERGARIEAAGRVALVPDASDDLFVYDTVAAECRRADRRAAKAGAAAPVARSETRSCVRTRSDPGASVRGSVHRVIRGSPSTRRRPRGSPGSSVSTRTARDLAARLARHPRDLSVGERRCLALAIQLAGDPAVLLVDEPTRGLDPAARAVVWRAIRGLRRVGDRGARRLARARGRRARRPRDVDGGGRALRREQRRVPCHNSA